jgi:CBS domain-containing protein
MGTSIRDVMTERPRAVTRQTTLSEVAEVMGAEDVGAIPVVEGDRLVGIVTDRDIVVRAVARGSDPSSTTVADVVTESLVTVSPEHDLADALKLMAQHQVRRLPVTDREDRLVGVVSQADVALQVKEKTTGELLEDISRPSSGPRVLGSQTQEPIRDEEDAPDTTREQLP